MGKFAFIDNIFGTDDEEETEANDDFYDDDSEEDDDEVAEDEELPVEDEDMLARLDKEFRKLRARVRGSTDLSELRSIRADQTAALEQGLTPTVRLRTLDIIEIIDDRITDLRARRGRSD